MSGQDFSQLEVVNAQLTRRIGELQSTATEVRDARRAALNLLEDVVEAQNKSDELNRRLQGEIVERKGAQDALRLNEHRTSLQKEALEAAVNGAPLGESLAILARVLTEEEGGEVRSAFYVVDPDGTCLHPVPGAGNMAESYLRKIDGFKVGENSLACGLAVPTKRPVLTRDVFEEPLWKPWIHLAQEYDFRGCWSFPIKTRDKKALGTFALYFRGAREASAQDIALGEVVTQAASIIISHHVESQQRARVEEALRKSEQRLARELADAKQLQAISSMFIEQEDPETLYRGVIDAAIAVMHSDAASLQILETETNELRLLAWKGFHPDTAAFWQRLTNETGTACGMALSRGERLIVPDVNEAEFLKNSVSQEQYRLSKITAIQSTPLLSRDGRMLGMISTHWHKRYEPTERELALLDVVARQAADMLERSWAAEALRRSEEEARRSRDFDEAVMKNMSEGLYTVDEEGRITSMNPAAEKLFGWTFEELRGRVMHDATHHKHRDGTPFPRDKCPGLHALKEGAAHRDCEDVFIRKDGTFFDVIYSAAPLMESGKVSGLVVVFRDVSERKRQEAHAQRQAKLIELSFEPIIVWDLDEGILEWNTGAEFLYGYSRDEALGRHTHELLKTKRDIPLRKFRELLLRDGSWSGELRHVAKDGREIIGDSRHQLVEIGGRRIVLETIWDITERKAAEHAARERARQQAALYHFVQRRQEAKSLGELYRAALDTIIDAIGCERAAILIRDEKGVMRFAAWRGLSERYRKAAEGHSPWAPDAIDPEPVCIADISNADLPRRIKAAIKAEGIRAVSFIPLTVGGRLVGKFMIYHGEVHECTEDELSLAVSIVVQLAIGIESARAEEALRDSEERMRTLANAVPQIIWTNDPHGKATYFNQRWYEYSGLSLEESTGGGWEAIVHPDDAPAADAKWRAALASGEIFDCEYRLRRADGEYRWFIGRNIPLKDKEGIVGWFGSATDIHDRKEAEYLLAMSEERFRLLVEGARDYAIFMVNPSNVITHWNAGAERVFGWKAEEAVGKSGQLVFTPEDRKKKQEEKEIECALRRGSANDRRWHIRKDGTRIWVDGVMHRLNDEHTGALRGFAKIARDATAERKAQQELEQRVKERTAELSAANARLNAEMSHRSRLEQEILLISEREKRRIGQDLHDSVCQELAATAFLLESTAQRLGKRNPTQGKIFSEAARAVNANVGLARDLARGLHPVELGSGGLPAALRELAYRVGHGGKMECRFRYPKPVRIRDDAISLNLYRIAQEAVTNAIKHGSPRQITITLGRSRAGLQLEVSDDGEGMAEKRRTKGMGIDIMQHRANVIGGQLSIESGKGRGTTVICTLPGE